MGRCCFSLHWPLTHVSDRRTSFEADPSFFLYLELQAGWLRDAAGINRARAWVCCEVDPNLLCVLQRACPNRLSETWPAELKQHLDQVRLGQVPPGQPTICDSNKHSMIGGGLELLRRSDQLGADQREREQNRAEILIRIGDFGRLADRDPHQLHTKIHRGGKTPGHGQPPPIYS